MAKFQDKERIKKELRKKERIKGSKGETVSNIQESPNKVSNRLLNGNAPNQKRMTKNIPSNESQRPTTQTTLPSKALNQDRRPNKEFPRQKKSRRIHFHQTSSARDAKGTALMKGRKKERQRNTGRKKWQ